MATELNLTSLDPSKNFIVKASKIYTGPTTNLTLDVSGNNNLYINTNSINKAIIGSNIASGNAILNTCVFNVGTTDTSNNLANMNVYGTYFSDAVSAIKIPANDSNNRPPGKTGYIRYNTTFNIIEYWNAGTSTWTNISALSPTVVAISPNYVSEDSSSNFTITGTNFETGSSVSFIGNVDNITYAAFGPTNFNSSTSLQARNTLTMSDASNNTGFFVKVTNASSGSTGISSTAILSFNAGPIWVTNALTNLGTGISSITYTKLNKPFTDLSANDTGGNYPITFAYTSGGNPVGASGVILDASGILYGTMPTITTSVSSTYDFTAIATDSLGALGITRTFRFSVSIPIATISGGTSLVGYTDSSGNNFTQSSPYLNGYTVYVFTAGSSITFTTTNYFPPYVSYLIVGGGGAGGAGNAGGSGGGGGGAGGYLTGYTAIAANTAYTINVGSGGTGSAGAQGGNGSSSSISGTSISLTASGGGGGAPNFAAGSNGGSGGGGGLRGADSSSVYPGGSGNTPSTIPSQGNAGGNTMYGVAGGVGRGGGGGGALAAGAGGNGNSQNNANYSVGPGGTGGSGLSNNLRGTGNVFYSGGGGSGGYDRLLGVGGSGGGGSGSGSTGAVVTSVYSVVGTAGTANTGGGGGGSTTGSATTGPGIAGGNGGSGIVILRHLSNIISSSVASSFTINGSTYSGTAISGTYNTYAGYNTGANTTAGTAVVTYVDSTGSNPRAWSSGAYSGGYTIVTFTTTTPVANYTYPSPNNPRAAAAGNQVLYYANQTLFTFNATSPFPAQVEYLIVGGGGTGAKGTGAKTYGGGGGAGQVLAGTTSISTGTNYTILVGSGGVMDANGASGSPVAGGDTVYYNLTTNGVPSSAFGLAASGGAGGNGGTNTVSSWNPAGTAGFGGVSGNGFLGGLGPANGANGTNPGGGGGGASGFGIATDATTGASVNSGGYGIASRISGTFTGYAAGGGGGGDSAVNWEGGSTPAGTIIGGKGSGSGGLPYPNPGTLNTGSGGGGMRADDIGAGGGGGTGIIIIKFPSFVC
uniref:Glycine-rich domain-containing protein n=1 Tax=viral metagenome TaxID=1070528 RepID=A0A6C0DSY9_9ZZZZ